MYYLDSKITFLNLVGLLNTYTPLPRLNPVGFNIHKLDFQICVYQNLGMQNFLDFKY